MPVKVCKKTAALCFAIVFFSIQYLRRGRPPPPPPPQSVAGYVLNTCKRIEYHQLLDLGVKKQQQWHSQDSVKGGGQGSGSPRGPDSRAHGPKREVGAGLRGVLKVIISLIDQCIKHRYEVCWISNVIYESVLRSGKKIGRLRLRFRKSAPAPASIPALRQIRHFTVGRKLYGRETVCHEQH